MRRISTKNRIIALALCFLMVMSLFPSSAFANTDAETSVVGRTATFAGDSVNLYSDPANWQYSMVAASELPQSVVITEVSGDYYKITGADGTWPEDYAGLNYVKSTELKLDEIATPDPSESVDPSESSEPTESSEPSTTESEGSCVCCEDCTNAEGCVCVCENDCAFCDPEVSCGCCEDCTDDETCTCQCGECTFCEEEDTTDPSEGDDSYVDTTLHSESGVAISGIVPVGAAPAASAMESNIYDIRILNADGNEWQPIDEGKTVTIQIPVTGVADGEYVDVYHFIDYAPDIDGDEEIISIDGIDDAARAILQPAINAYGDGHHIAVEVTQKAMVSGGKVSVLTDSFSVYIVNGQGNFELAEEEGYVKFSNWTGAGDVYTAYASPGTTFTLYTQFVGFKDNPYSLVQPYPEGVVLENGTLTEDGFFFDYEIKTAKVTLNGVSVGDRITIKYDRVGENDLTLIIEIVEEVTISYDANGVTDAKVPASHGAVVDGETGIAVKNIVSVPNGYKFVGWNTSPGGDGTPYSVDKLNDGTAVINPTKDTTLYAMWEKQNYTIKYDTNKGSGTFENQTKTHGTDLILHSDEPTREGYKFLGWCTTKDGSTTKYQPGGTFTANADATLYALWGVKVDLAIDNVGTITYYNDKYEETPDNNSATLDNPYRNDKIIEGSYANCKLGFTPAENYVITGVTVNGISDSNFTANSYTYSVGADGFTKDTNIVVTTAPLSYTVTYHGNEPAGVTAQATVPAVGNKAYGEAYTITGGATLTGYIFKGWNTAANGSGTAYAANATIPAGTNANIDLYAQWDMIDLIITKVIDNQDKYQGVPDANTSFQFAVTFTGVTGDVHRIIYHADGTIASDGYMPNGDSVNLQDGWYVVFDTIPAGTHYTIEEKSAYDEYTNGAPVTGTTTEESTVEVTITNIFKKNADYKVKHYLEDPNEASGYRLADTENKHGVVGQKTEAGAKKTYEGYAANAFEQVTIISDDSAVVNIYYDRVENAISYVIEGTTPTGATGIPTATTGEYGVEYNVAANAAANGYTFSGWTTNDATIEDGKFTMPANAVTFTGSFTKINYTITYNLDGGTVETANLTSYNVETPTFTLTNPIKTGYTFAGWTGTGLDSATETVTISKGSTGDREYAAQWEINMVTLTIHSEGADQSIFEVKGTTIEDESVSLTVAINGTGNKTIIVPAGTYEVIPQNDWSWRCADVEALSKTISQGSETLEFSFTQNNPYWLDGCDYKTN